MAQTTGLNKEIFAKPFFPNSLPVEITRTFRAPLESVWYAWTTGELVQQWWGPEGYSCPEAKIEFRVGGKYLFAMKGPDQKVSWSGGEILEIIENQEIVYTDHFTDERGNPVAAAEYGMSGTWPEDLFVTVKFERLGDEHTRIHLIHEGIPKELHDDCVKGWNSSLDKLQKLVVRS
jgi:uncharacterized protein YndB with AHSA1/START domain